MKTVAVVSQKGGVGKTTAVIQIGFAAHQARLVTAIIDLDPQGTVAKWGGRRDGDIALQAATISDFVLIPTRPSGLDVEAIQTTIEMVENLGRPSAILINSVPTNRQPLASTILHRLGKRGFAVAPVLWMERPAFADLGTDDMLALERDADPKRVMRSQVVHLDPLLNVQQRAGHLSNLLLYCEIAMPKIGLATQGPSP
jgi:chromosome partitioning protein